jgi:hypothetical protein
MSCKLVELNYIKVEYNYKINLHKHKKLV